MASRIMTTQKKKDLKDQYQVADLKEYDVMHTHTTAYPTRIVVTGEQWSEKLGSKRMVRTTPPSPVEKVSNSEIVDTEEEVQFKRPIKRTLKEKLQAKDDSQRYSMSDIQLISYLLDVTRCGLDSISRRGQTRYRGTECVLAGKSPYVPKYHR